MTRFLLLFVVAFMTAFAPVVPAFAAPMCAQVDNVVDVSDAGDLNGDGKAEVAVTYKDPVFPRFSYLMIAEKNGKCLTPVYKNEVGHRTELIGSTAHANGWDSLKLLFTDGSITMTVQADHDGSTYRWTKMLECSGGKAECQDAFKSFAP